MHDDHAPPRKRPTKRRKRPTKQPTMSVPQAGKYYFNLGRNASYQAAKCGQIPTIKILNRIRAIVAELDRMVGIGQSDDAA
jgi:hypothetical protein